MNERWRLFGTKKRRRERYEVRDDAGTPDAIRTHDLQSRSLTLYPAELQAHMGRNGKSVGQKPENAVKPENR